MGKAGAPGLADLVSVVIAPREKHSTLAPSLRSLFATIPPDVPVIACLPQLPGDVRAETAALMQARGNCQLQEFEPDLIPHQARAMGAERVRTPWVVFADNDLHYEQRWLEELAVVMRAEIMDVLAPLIFIGPPNASVIHHAGGILKVTGQADGLIAVREQHRLMNRRLEETGVAEKIASAEFERCDVAEFHCLAMRTGLLNGTVTLPPELITREQQDLALQCRKHALKVGFVPGARVTYMAKSPFTEDDLRYHAARWSEARACRSLDYMESRWRMDFDRQRVLYRWIEKHRRRPFVERASPFIRRLPRQALGFYLQRRYGYTV